MAANSHSTGLVKSILALGSSMLLVMVMLFQSVPARDVNSLAPLFRGERVGVRGSFHELGWRGEASTRLLRNPTSPRERAGRGERKNAAFIRQTLNSFA